MSSPHFEEFLARLYTDQALLERFLSDPAETCRGFGLNEAECESMRSIDITGLRMAVASFNHKRAAKSSRVHQRPA